MPKKLTSKQKEGFIYSAVGALDDFSDTLLGVVITEYGKDRQLPLLFTTPVSFMSSNCFHIQIFTLPLCRLIVAALERVL